MLTTAIFVAFMSALVASILLVLSQPLHGRYSTDGTFGLQKFHTQPTSRIGGVGIVTALVLSYFAAPSQVKLILGPMLVAAVPAFGIGLLEDITKAVKVSVRLLATMLSGLIAWYLTGVAMQDSGIAALDWALAYLPLAVVFTAFAVGGVANAINIIDGFNGLATGVVLIMLAALGLMALHQGDSDLANVCMLVAACTLGFGPVNWPFGKIFLGDGGAYLLGFFIAWIAVLLPMRNSGINACATLLACAYPVIEVGFSVWRKSLRKGHSPGKPDRLHLHMLVHRRVARPLFKNLSPTYRNSFTSPFCWVYSALPAAWAVFFATNTSMLLVGFALATLLYAAVYARLTQFRWCFRAVTLLPKIPQAS